MQSVKTVSPDLKSSDTKTKRLDPNYSRALRNGLLAILSFGGLGLVAIGSAVILFNIAIDLRFIVGFIITVIGIFIAGFGFTLLE